MTDAEIDKLERGMIVLYHGSAGLRPRIVRQVTRDRDDRVRFVCFVKLRCSQYATAITTIDRSTLRREFEWTGVRAKLDKPLDQALIDEASRCNRPKIITCRQTLGAYV